MLRVAQILTTLPHFNAFQRWKKISDQIPGRSVTDVKNRWDVRVRAERARARRQEAARLLPQKYSQNLAKARQNGEERARAKQQEAERTRRETTDVNVIARAEWRRGKQQEAERRRAEKMAEHIELAKQDARSEREADWMPKLTELLRAEQQDREWWAPMPAPMSTPPNPGLLSTARDIMMQRNGCPVSVAPWVGALLCNETKVSSSDLGKAVSCRADHDVVGSFTNNTQIEPSSFTEPASLARTLLDNRARDSVGMN